MGPDKPGMLNRLASVIHHHEGKWISSKMIQLDGQFASIIKVDAPAEKIKSVQDALMTLPDIDLKIHQNQPTENISSQQVHLHVDARDASGIVSDINQVFASHGVGVEQMEYHRMMVAEGGETVFTADMDLTIPGELDPNAIVMDLKRLQEQIVVEVSH
jgi:glycine cleavage system regulatory protein